MHNDLIEYLLRLGDSALIQGQRLSQWIGRAPALEEELALANVGLDLIGQARHWLEYAAQRLDDGRDADALAFLRSEREMRNVLLVEQPNGDFAVTMLKQFLYDAWHFEVLSGLGQSSDERIAGIATKGLKEVTYHLRRSSEWVERLGDGTEESHARMLAAIPLVWRFTHDLLQADALEHRLHAGGVIGDQAQVATAWHNMVADVFARATLPVPAPASYFYLSSHQGLHSEHLGMLLAEMQYLPRAYPMQPGELIGSDRGARAGSAHDLSQAWAVLGQVMDPEVPVVSVVELGIVRAVSWQAGHLHVVVTPTYSGCPATEVIESDIRQALEHAGFDAPHLQRTLMPAWTTDWITDSGRQRLRDYGIAPPEHSTSKRSLLGEAVEIRCPQCGSTHTELLSQFGSTACKALYRCCDCREPFDYFKCI